MIRNTTSLSKLTVADKKREFAHGVKNAEAERDEAMKEYRRVQKQKSLIQLLERQQTLRNETKKIQEQTAAIKEEIKGSEFSEFGK